MESLPLSDERTYESFEPSVFDYDDYFRVICSYERTEIDTGEDMILEAHARPSAEIWLYRAWEDSPNSRIQFHPELPVSSSELADWVRTAWTRDDRDVLWEGCGVSTLCREDQEATVRTHRSRWEFRGHVGNLDFEVTVLYIAEQLPVDLESQVVAIYRDLVLAVVDRYQLAD